MDKITICDLEVFCRVGVPDEERARPQRLLFTIEILSDFTAAASSDDLADTIDYDALSKRIVNFGSSAEWKLIETLAIDVAEMMIQEFSVKVVTVEIKKFILPQTRHVSVTVTRRKDGVGPD